MAKCRLPLDLYDLKPDGMIAYLRNNGYHFSKKASEWAASIMRKNREAITPFTKEKVEEILKANSITLENNIGYDSVFVANMAKSDFYKSSITDEAHLALFIKDYVDDEDKKDGFIFNRFFADCVHDGIPIPWEDIL